MFTCPCCSCEKPEAEMCKRTSGTVWCKPCWRQYSQEWRDRNREKTRNGLFLKKYGITLAVYNVMLVAQGGVCAICHQPETALDRGGQNIKPLSVDHCHDTGKVRGLLCSRCNLGIGHLDQIALLESALRYLNETAVALV